MPEWYSVIQAARYLGVAPWDLLDQPVAWYDFALEAESAEISAKNHRRQQEERKKAMRAKMRR